MIQIRVNKMGLVQRETQGNSDTESAVKKMTGVIYDKLVGNIWKK